MKKLANNAAIQAALAAAIAVMFAISPTDADAQSRLCRQLEAQLAASSAGGGSADFRKYDRAAKTQREQLDKAQQRARRNGCTSGVMALFRKSANSNECHSLNAKIGQMERNLAELERRRDRYDRGNTGSARSGILARIVELGCREEKPRVAERELPEIDRSRQVNILDQIFSENSRRRAPLDDEYGNRIKTVLNSDSGGIVAPAATYRTMCVRTCDGYYFPVSFSATENDFDRDQLACQAMCPGTDVVLYYHKVYDEESEDMISVAGEPYRELSTAFMYRQPGYKREKSCGCSPVKNFSIIAGNENILQEQAGEPFVPMPTERPDPAADPETLANRAGDLSPDTIARILEPAPGTVGAPETAERRVRVVGPAFLPDPEAAIDLQARDQSAVQ